MSSQPTVDLVIFDMDGVIFQGRNFWLDLHRAMGTEAEAWRLWHAYGKHDYPRLGAITVEQVWIGRSAVAFHDLIASRTYVDGAADVISWLRQHAVRTAIVSSGPYQLAERAQRELGIDVIRANRVAIAGTIFTGTVDLQVDDTRKDLAATTVMTELGIRPSRTAMVGDTASDSRLAGIVGRLIAYDPDSPELTAAADAVIPSGHLRDLISLFESPRQPNGTTLL
jgi:HAD superfamily phosphoserine phosphatase-like hydrolase